MGFGRPQLLLLLLLLAAAFPLVRVPGHWSHTALRMLIAGLLLFALAGPRLDLTEKGMDLIVIVDRSLSVGAEGLASEVEILSLLGKARTRGDRDRIAVVGFGAHAHVQDRPTTGPVSIRMDMEVDQSASNLAQALLLSARMRSPHRRTRVLVLSDGLATGQDPLSSSVLAELSDLPVWHRRVGDVTQMDVAAHSITLPTDVPEKAGFIVRFALAGQAGASASYTLSRGDSVLVSGEATLTGGVDTFFARDIADEPGSVEYRLDVKSAGDTVPENDSASALLAVVSAPRALVASSTPTPGIIVRSLAEAGIAVDTVPAFGMDASAAKLAPYRLVVLENVPMQALGHDRAAALADTVSAGVAALFVTGGPTSFGQGGYHLSPIDPILPVTMELREDQLEGVMALVAVLDRSGSMAVEAGAGRTKMDLANMGVAEAIRLLAPNDQVSVIAVDCAPHVVIPLVQADETEKLVKAVLRIQSEGGGIFVRTALTAATEQARKSGLPTRHILLFSDAADSEEQEDSVAFARKLGAEGIDISVVGLGTPGDPDAHFLRMLATAGNGTVTFTRNASELPRIFSQEVIRIANRGFIKESSTLVFLPDLVRLQLPLDTRPPTLGGYNLCSLRKGASAAAMTGDESKTPVVSFWRTGRASVGTITAEVDGPYSGDLSTWPATQELIVNMARLLASGITAADARAYSSIDGSTAEVHVEMDDETATALRTAAATVRFLAPPGEDPLDVPLVFTGPNTAVASVDLDRPGHYLPVLDMGEAGVLRAPAITLPYSPEFLPQVISGEETLAALSKATGGQPLVSAGDAFDTEGITATAAWRDISHLFALAALLFLLLEIAQRRLSLF